jgi:hypothetical protein
LRKAKWKKTPNKTQKSREKLIHSVTACVVAANLLFPWMIVGAFANPYPNPRDSTTYIFSLRSTTLRSFSRSRRASKRGVGLNKALIDFRILLNKLQCNFSNLQTFDCATKHHAKQVPRS